MSYSGLNRMPILMVGPLLHRIGEAFVPLVGGDRIGSRPVDFHVEALRQFGAEVELTDEGLEAKALRLHGAHFALPFPSVGATETVLLTAAVAEGRTILENAAIEPEVVELALLLQRMGARIELQPDRRFVIEGVSHLHRRQPTPGRRPHRGLLLPGGRAGHRGQGPHLRLRPGPPGHRHLHPPAHGRPLRDRRRHHLREADELRPAAVQTSPHPGFMTDWQPPLVVLCTRANGMSVVHETVFEDRLGYVDALRSMDAEVELFEQCLVGDACRFQESGSYHSALVRGGRDLQGAEVEMPDIRGAFAYVIAAAAAEGPSILHGVHHLERGYDQALAKFSELGLRITPS